MARSKHLLNNANHALEQELRRRAQHLERRYSELEHAPKPSDFDVFNEENPSELPGKLGDIAGRTIVRGVMMAAFAAVVNAAFIVAESLVTSSGATLLSAFANSGQSFAVFAMVGGALGAGSGALEAAMEDRKPLIHQQQLAKYHSHLDDFEKQHQPAFDEYKKKQEEALAKEQEKDAEEKVWQERVENTISVASELLPL